MVIFNLYKRKHYWIIVVIPPNYTQNTPLTNSFPNIQSTKRKQQIVFNLLFQLNWNEDGKNPVLFIK